MCAIFLRYEPLARDIGYYQTRDPICELIYVIGIIDKGYGNLLSNTEPDI